MISMGNGAPETIYSHSFTSITSKIIYLASKSKTSAQLSRVTLTLFGRLHHLFERLAKTDIVHCPNVECVRSGRRETLNSNWVIWSHENKATNMQNYLLDCAG